ncbi:MAG TPA: chromosome segregation protein SMC [Verrucomicrobiales bacterium]|nr:chromosome segregation protein SMC [Verrucomicrobiales bacterium]
MPESPRLIHHLKPRSILSFGSEFSGIELGALNLLIGPNGSGKSNLLEVLDFMRASVKDFAEATRKSGGVKEWLWKGNKTGEANVELTMDYPRRPTALRHSVAFIVENQRLFLEDERVEDASEEDTRVYYAGLRSGEPQVSVFIGKEERKKPIPSLNPTQSIVSQLVEPSIYPELRWLASKYEGIRIYREWSFGRNTLFRIPQPADMRRDVLEEDFSNLGLFLNRLKTEFPAAKRALLKALQDLYEGITDFEVNTNGGTVQVFLHEGDFAIPATRLSDGTLRYLCLLAILCDPKPPPLICIEEPELGLHPDILPGLADLLRAASERTQLIVTTHSDILVDAMTETPECVIVCEKHEGQTEMKRLDAGELSVWLQKYRLGQLWIDGQLGGKRW